MKMAKERVFHLLVIGVFMLCLWGGAFGDQEGLVRREDRRLVSASESGSISAVDVRDWIGRANYHLQFITMEPDSLFLPVILHSDMLFYVHSGRAKINYIEKESRDSENKKKESRSDGTKSIDVERGDVYRLEQGTTFYIRSYPAPTRVKFRIYAIFNTAYVEDPREQLFGAYSNISDLVRGFDEKILQSGFAVSEDLVQSIKWAERTPPIIPYVRKNESSKRRDDEDNTNWKEGIIESVVESVAGVGRQTEELNKKKKSKSRTFNFYNSKPDVKNCYGWSTAITRNKLEAFESIDIGAFMVNLTTGSMMGPHWNPKATEIAIVIHGQGMIQTICPTNVAGKFIKDSKCQNALYRVKEGDVFVVPKHHPMAQISFNNDSFVFVGFTTDARNNYPQFLAGERSVLREIDGEILKAAFGAPNVTVVERLVRQQKDAVILGCTSCGEELVEKAEEEEERRRAEEERREKKEREEEEKEREEEERRREEEEERQREEEEEAKRREEEEAKKREEEEEARRREEEEEQARKREQEEEEEARRREEEQARKREQEEEARRREEEEEARKREEQEEEARRREEEQAEREEEEARRREEEEGEQWVRKNLKKW